MAIVKNPPLPSTKPTNKDNALSFIAGDSGASMIPNLSASGGAAGPANAGSDSANSGVTFGNSFQVQGAGSTSANGSSKFDNQTLLIIGALAVFVMVVLKKK